MHSYPKFKLDTTGNSETMSRLIIILCSVFFATASHTQPSVWSSDVENVTLEAQKTINATYSDIQEKFDTTQREYRNTASTILERAKKFERKFKTEISAVKSKISGQILNLTEAANNIDVSDCLSDSNRLVDEAQALYSSTVMCVGEKVGTAFTHLMSTRKIFESEFTRLETIKEEVQHCTDNIYNRESAVAAMDCVRTAEDKAKSASTKFMNDLADNVSAAKFHRMSQPTLAQCTITDESKNFRLKNLNVLRLTKTCIEGKIGYKIKTKIFSAFKKKDSAPRGFRKIDKTMV